MFLTLMEEMDFLPVLIRFLREQPPPQQAQQRSLVQRHSLPELLSDRIFTVTYTTLQE